MYTVTHLLLALIISMFLRCRFSRRALLLFSVGSFLPDLDHLYMHRYLLHNIFFFIATFIFSRALGLGVGFHFLGDILASSFNTLFYPLAVLDIGVGFSFLYSAWFNIVVAAVFISLLILGEGYLVKRRGLRDLAAFILMVGASLSFGASKALELIFGYTEPVLVEAARFGSVALLITIYYFVSSTNPKGIENRYKPKHPSTTATSINTQLIIINFII